MAIRERTNITNYPAALTVVENPFTCGEHPNIQALADELMSSGLPSVIIGGKIFTEETVAAITILCTP